MLNISLNQNRKNPDPEIARQKWIFPRNM